MSDQSNQPAAPPGPNSAPEPQQGQVPLTVKAQYIKDFSFENPRAPQSFQATQGPPSIQISVNVGAHHIQAQDYEVSLTINVDAKASDQPLFMVELNYAGVFTLGAVPQEHMRPLLLIEGPRLLFPFARNIIADATREGGYPPLFMQPVDFVDLYRREIAQQARPN
jgi:preprotein translocase subunit SecB